LSIPISRFRVSSKHDSVDAQGRLLLLTKSVKRKYSNKSDRRVPSSLSPPPHLIGLVYCAHITCNINTDTVLFIKQINGACICSHTNAVYTSRSIQRVKSRHFVDVERRWARCRNSAVRGFNKSSPFHLPLFSRWCPSLSISQVLLLYISWFSLRKRIYIALYWLARHPDSFQHPVERIAVSKREKERERELFGEYFFYLPRCWHRESIV